MGIKKLLTILDIVREGKIQDYQGKKVGVDGYAWIHKCLYNNGHDYVVHKDKSTYFTKIFNMFVNLLDRGIKVCVIFDGDKLPSKQGTEHKREGLREEKKVLANLYLQQGNHELANKKLTECIDVTPQLAFETYQFLRHKKKLDFEVIVAPYEADAQLGYLSKIGYIDAVISEDSDMLVFGAKKIIFKLTRECAFDEIRLEELGNNKMYSFDGWTHDQFIQFCILCGCDYLKNLHHQGIKRIYPLFNNNFRKMKYIFQSLASNNSIEDFNLQYIEAFERAYLTFKYQRVYCPLKKKMVSLNSIHQMDLFDDDDMRKVEIQDRDKKVAEFDDLALLQKYASKEAGLSFLGPIIADELMVAIATCKTDPISKKEFAASQEPFVVTDRAYDTLRQAASLILPRPAEQPAQQKLHSFFYTSTATNPLLMTVGSTAAKEESKSQASKSQVSASSKTSLRGIFEQFKIDDRKSIVQATISNFRQSYLQTCKKYK